METQKHEKQLSERIPWNGNRVLTFYDIHGTPYQREVQIERVIGMGASCICYAVSVDFGDRNIHKMILKQFCPEPFLSEAEQRHLAVLFEQAYELQNHLANTDALMDLIVRPYEKFFSEKERYILYEANYGDSLEKRNIEDLDMQLRLMLELTEALERLHRCGILHMDLKPENILWTTYGGIKFFDFDAAIILDRLDEVHEIRGAGNQLGLLAPELRNLSEFEQNKKLLLHPRVDVYAVGAMLFHWFFDCYPVEMQAESESGSWEIRLRELFDTRFRGKLSDSQQELLAHIIKKSIAVSAGRKGRYRCAGEMAADLRMLLHSVHPLQEETQKTQICEVNYRLLAAHFLWKHPLYPYIRKDMQGNRVLDVILFGASSIREAFLIYIFSCAQMPGVKLHIHIAAEDALSYAQSLMLRFPQLKSTVEICCDGERQPLQMDPAIVSEPLAGFYFYTCEETVKDGFSWLQTWKQWIGGQDKGQNIQPYILLHMKDGEKNYQLAERMNRWFTEDEPNRTFCCFLGYGDDRGDGYRLRKQRSLAAGVEMDVFGTNAKYSIEEKDFGQDIGKLAYRIHCQYAEEWNPELSLENLWQDFSNDPYKMNSSIRSALAVRYKLACAGISFSPKASGQFHHLVLEQKAENPHLYNRLLALEHKSWLCYMIMEGYQRPTEKQLRKYAFSGRNDQRDRRHKLHPCICEFQEEKGMPLLGLFREEWDALTAEGTGWAAWEEFDAMDRTSLLLHQICEIKTERLDLTAQFQKLREELELEEAETVVFQMLEELRDAYEEMLRGSENANQRWDRCCGRFSMALRQMEETHGLYDEEIKDAFQMIQEDMRVVRERNLYHDYKKSDESILTVIPQVLQKYFSVHDRMSESEEAYLHE